MTFLLSRFTQRSGNIISPPTELIPSLPVAHCFLILKKNGLLYFLNPPQQCQ